jgi:hypothetical protein
MLGWSDYMTVSVDGTPERHKLTDWLTYNPCAVIQEVNKGGGPYLLSTVYFRFTQKAQGCWSHEEHLHTARIHHGVRNSKRWGNTK